MRPVTLSISWFLAVSMMMPIFEPEARMRRQTSNPSISGSITSSSARQMSGLTFSFSRASSPLAASMGSKPLRRRLMTTKLRILDSSSKTKIFFIWRVPLKVNKKQHQKGDCNILSNYNMFFTKIIDKVSENSISFCMQCAKGYITWRGADGFTIDSLEKSW